jgi:hypothetical protein
MTKHHKTSQSVKSVSGGTFVGIGLHILSGNLSGDVNHLRHLVDVPGGDALGLLPSITLAASKAARAYALDHVRFLDGLLYLVASLWPLLLVVVGIILLQNILNGKVKVVPAPHQYFRSKYFQNKGAECRFRCPSFDV